MIVKDKVASIKKAFDICDKLIEVIKHETVEFECDDDPAEQIYLVIHIVASLESSIIKMLESYGLTYGIENLSAIEMKSWIESLVMEYMQMKRKS